jgi:dTDP-4-amino-4,6-dideoxygalactose transaminase
MGLLNLNYISKILSKRKQLAEYYDYRMKDLKVLKPKWNIDATQNYPYYVIILESEELLLKIKNGLDKNNIYTRRYFYPSLANSLPYLEAQYLEVTDDIAKRVLCLPFFYDLTFEDIDTITDLILKFQNN